MSKTQIICHFVFGTHRRRGTLIKERRRELYKYIYGILNNLGCYLIRINGIEDHVHILTEVNPSIAVSDIMKKVKQSSSHWIKENRIFPEFDGWGKGYFAVSVSPKDKEICRQYILNQEEHHKSSEYVSELKSMIEDLGLQWYEEEW